MSLRAATLGKRQRLVLLGPTEDQVQRAVVDLLARAGAPGLAFTHMPSGGDRHPVVAAKLKAAGTKAGWPDLLLVIEGRLHGLELKTDRGRLSAAQTAAHAELVRAGAVVETAYGLDEAIEILGRWGALGNVNRIN